MEKFTSDYLNGKDEALEDLEKGKLKFMHVGKPVKGFHDWKSRLKSIYNIEVEVIALSLIPREEMEFTKGYNSISIEAIEEKHGKDFLVKTLEESRKIIEETEQETSEEFEKP